MWSSFFPKAILGIPYPPFWTNPYWELLGWEIFSFGKFQGTLVFPILRLYNSDKQPMVTPASLSNLSGQPCSSPWNQQSTGWPRVIQRPTARQNQACRVWSCKLTSKKLLDWICVSSWFSRTIASLLPSSLPHSCLFHFLPSVLPPSCLPFFLRFCFSLFTWGHMR